MWSATRMTLKYSVFWTNLLFFVFNCSSDKFGNLMYLKVMLFFAVVLHWMFTFLLYWCNYFYRKESHHEMAYRLIVRSPVLVWLCFFNLSLIVLIFFSPSGDSVIGCCGQPHSWKLEGKNGLLNERMIVQQSLNLVDNLTASDVLLLQTYGSSFLWKGKILFTHSNRF